MQHPISVHIYSCFGGWRIECKTCGEFVTIGFYDKNLYSIIVSSGKRTERSCYSHRSLIGFGIHELSQQTKNCNHSYGNYNPRVTYRMRLRDVPLIKSLFSNQGCENFPAILIDNKYRIEIDGNVDKDWSAYSIVRNSMFEEKIQNKEQCLAALLKNQSDFSKKQIDKAEVELRSSKIIFVAIVIFFLICMIAGVSHKYH